MSRFGTRRDRAASAPFDAPCDDGYLGVRHEHGTLLTVLAIHPGPARPTPLDRPWHGNGDHGLSWAALTQWMNRPESAATDVTVLTHGTSVGDDGPAGRAYRTLLGPLSVAADRTVHVAIRFAPLRHPDLVARHGHGSAAALRAALSATRRLAGLLRADGLAVTGLTAAELSGMAQRLHPGTTAVDMYAVEPPDPAELPEALEAIWRHSAAACTMLRWRPGEQGPTVRAVARIDDGPGVYLRGDLPPHWTPLSTAADKAAGTGPRRHRPRLTAAAPGLASAMLPISGAGVILGADDAGRPVAVRLTGPDVPVAEISGGPLTAQRIAVRLAALGLTAAVFTDRPQQWQPVIDAVDDRRLLHPAADGAAQILIDDRPDSRLGPLAEHTVLRVHRGQRETGHDAGVPGVHQNPANPSRAVLTGGGRRLAVELVTTPAENALLHRA
ncbi:hypothetical protein GOHSU_04_00750 [Gordonia hirsuta DSM 44140 = NBRC 16056]|uniref:Type VII secretion system protein EccE domain-containing protein n=1 Tax=Gordonia hirsuta DSM 44140 = NBRC 16056 TaxID=1121927 RepID=L7L616_9ACTN|nr:type VII secretion protein EccE [Gordonia hirsuta]GAC56206.1 hypothetical protein GOHSU_04_00750 [Gordonia hirsuta DSM 44140 = NBRC 16056]